jgi:hypothetical protein
MLKAQGRKNGLRNVGKCVAVGNKDFDILLLGLVNLDGTAPMTFQS